MPAAAAARTPGTLSSTTRQLAGRHALGRGGRQIQIGRGLAARHIVMAVQPAGGEIGNADPGKLCSHFRVRRIRRDTPGHPHFVQTAQCVAWRPGIGSTSLSNTLIKRWMNPCTQSSGSLIPSCASTTGTMLSEVMPRKIRSASAARHGPAEIASVRARSADWSAARCLPARRRNRRSRDARARGGAASNSARRHAARAIATRCGQSPNARRGRCVRPHGCTDPGLCARA